MYGDLRRRKARFLWTIRVVTAPFQLASLNIVPYRLMLYPIEELKILEEEGG
jgi:hypothetical protein